MSDAPSSKTSDRTLAPDIINAIRYYLGGRRAWFVLAAVLVLGGIAANWGWLVAIGVAPILIAFLPCAVMCVLGVCMQKAAGNRVGRSVAGDAQPEKAFVSNSGAPAVEAPDLIDPVSQRALPATTAIATVYRGLIYYFEDRANRDAFEADPEKYFVGLQSAQQVASAPSGVSHHAHRPNGSG